MKFLLSLFLLSILINVSFSSTMKAKSKSTSKDKLIENLRKDLKDKSDYIGLLETFIREKLFDGKSSPSKNELKSFLELSEKASLKSKSKAGPVLKAMLFGFPNPRTYSFGKEDNSNLQNMKICEPGCMVMG